MKIQKQREAVLREKERKVFKMLAYSVRDILKHYALGGNSTRVVLDSCERQYTDDIVRAVNYLLPSGVKMVATKSGGGMHIRFCGET